MTKKAINVNILELSLSLVCPMGKLPSLKRGDN